MSNKRPIIIKKIKKIEGGHHGGAWKVAYADFVTAMMAFFLLMWLLNATTEEQRSGLADYFDPKIPISQTSSGGMSMFNGDSVFAQQKLARSGLGGSGKKAAAGRDDQERHEVSHSEDDVWSPAQKEAAMVGSKKELYELAGFEKDKETTNTINKNKMTADNIKKKILNSLNASGNATLTKHLKFKMTDEGLRVDITDDNKKPMFVSGSDKPSKNMQKIMSIVSTVFSELVNNIAITGHTDSQPLNSRKDYTNWELSSDRAHAARRILTKTGINPKRIQRIEGRADRDLFIKNDPSNAKNRRISIVLLHKHAQRQSQKIVQKKPKVKKKSIIKIPDPLAF